jgi:uncharacterized protein YxeA
MKKIITLILFVETLTLLSCQNDGTKALNDYIKSTGDGAKYTKEEIKQLNDLEEAIFETLLDVEVTNGGKTQAWADKQRLVRKNCESYKEEIQQINDL